jgi:hypothetical protein
VWIPHKRVVDPVPKPGDSQYHGDNHVGYDGWHRVLNEVEFGWDGQKITEFKGRDDYGTSIRYWKIGPFSGEEIVTATGYTGRELRTESYFHMWISSKNPIPWAPAPAIDSELEGFLSCRGVKIIYTTDEFPSHGIRVFRDGREVETKIVFDASGVPVEGTEGETAILLGLTEHTNTGSFELEAPELEACHRPTELPENVPP